MIGHTCRMWMHLIRLDNIVIRIDSHENIIKGPLRPIRYASPAASSLFDSLSISIALNTARRPVVIPPQPISHDGFWCHKSVIDSHTHQKVACISQSNVMIAYYKDSFDSAYPFRRELGVAQQQWRCDAYL
jgi:hypothetical protein